MGTLLSFSEPYIIILIELMERVSENTRAYFCFGNSEEMGAERRVQKLCEENRIPSVAKFSRMCLIPKDAEKPIDECRRENKKIILN